MRNLFLLIILFASIRCWGQHQITGRVFDNKKESVIGGEINLFAPNHPDNFLISTITKTDGSFVLNNISKGNYRLSVSCIGFARKFVDMEVLDKDVDLGDILLKDSVQQLNEIIVKADMIKTFGAKDEVLFTSVQKEKAQNGLELMRNVPQLMLNSVFDKLTTTTGEAVKILVNGMAVDEKELQSIKPTDIVKTEYYHQPPARFANLGISAVVNVVLKKERKKGGDVLLNLKNSFTTGFGTNWARINYNTGHNEYHFRYFVDYRDLNKNVLDRASEYRLNDGEYQYNENGLYGKYSGAYHIGEATFARTQPDNYYLNARLKFIITPMLEDYKQNVTGKKAGVDIGEFLARQRTKSNYRSPSLDLYFMKELKNNQELIANAVGTYYYSTSDVTLERGNDFSRQQAFNNKSYSLIAELLYSKKFANTELNIGGKHFYKKLDENYVLSAEGGDNNYALNDSYLYGNIQGKLSTLNYSAGIGAERISAGSNDKYSFFVLRPSLSIGADLSKSSSLNFNFSVRSDVPDISSLSEAPTYINETFISKGNSGVKPYYQYVSVLRYSYKVSSLFVQSSLAAGYADNPYYTVFRNDGAQAVKTIDNQGDEQRYEWSTGFRWSPFSWLQINSNYRLMYQQAKGDFGKCDLWSHRFFVYGSIFYKGFGAQVQYNPPTKTLLGELFQKEGSSTYADISWKRKKIGITLAYWHTLSPEETYTNENSLVKYYENKKWYNLNNLFYIQISYTLPFGKKIDRSIQKVFNNQDSDSGLSKDKQVKM